MFKARTLQSLVEEKIPFKLISTGWMVGKCQVCNDYKQRAGFKFEDGRVITNCWNCDAASVYEEYSGHISKKFRSILNAYGIDDVEIDEIVNVAFFNKNNGEDKKIKLADLVKVNTKTPKTNLPPDSVKLNWSSGEPIHVAACTYLRSRCLPSVLMPTFPFYVSINEHFKDRVIIPFYRNGNLIYWQARSILPVVKDRYKNAPTDRTAVMFNIDELRNFSNSPLFISEGIFDSLLVNGVSILGASLNDAKIKLLHESNRRIIFVIDKDKKGFHLGKQALELGYEITFTDETVEDINSSTQRFGLSWTINSLIKNISSGDPAHLRLELNCSKY